MKIRPKSKKWMKYADLIDSLLEAPYHLIDIYPIRIPEQSRGSYFDINDWILDNEYEELARRFFHILLKLNCYHDLTIYLGDRIIKNPAPDDLRKQVKKCFAAKQRHRHYMNIFVDKNCAMLILDGDSTCMTVYNADAELQKLLRMLSDAEGMFFREVP